MITTIPPVVFNSNSVASLTVLATEGEAAQVCREGELGRRDEGGGEGDKKGVGWGET